MARHPQSNVLEHYDDELASVFDTVSDGIRIPVMIRPSVSRNTFVKETEYKREEVEFIATSTIRVDVLEEELYNLIREDLIEAVNPVHPIPLISLHMGIWLEHTDDTSIFGEDALSYIRITEVGEYEVFVDCLYDEESGHVMMEQVYDRETIESNLSDFQRMEDPPLL